LTASINRFGGAAVAMKVEPVMVSPSSLQRTAAGLSILSWSGSPAWERSRTTSPIVSSKV
jgi:hypothetical protein